MTDPAAPHRTGYRFGAFKGVFTPSILTILGVIMYLRFGWVLGHLGLPLTLVAVTLATAITFLTALSLSAIATNMRIGGGGAYFIISRSLGPEAGAAIGLPLFLAQALGIAFYISGFSEALTGVFDFEGVVSALPFALSPERFVAVCTLLVLTAPAAFSANLALKTQFLIMAAIAVSLISFFAGALGPPLAAAPAAAPPLKYGFWVVFAVFFPAVTGIEAGIAMSGDLKNPAKALPRGTLAAVLAGYAVYMAIPFALSRAVPDERLLLTHNLILRDVARWGNLILLGVWAASLSSALGCLLGAPRTLQALARDRIIPGFLGRGYGPNNDPRTATVFSFAVALTAVLLGDLNRIAPVLTMFFLTSYGLINLSAGMESLIGSPSWRPTFRLWWWAALTGSGACFAVMFMINPGATFAAWAVTFGCYALMKRRRLNAQWGDMRYGMLMLLARFAIVRLSRRRPDERGWRPNILAFSGSPESRWRLIELADALARGPACLTLATVVPTQSWSPDRALKLQTSMREYLYKRGVQALVKVFPSEDLVSGADALIRGYGFGPIEPNTVLLGESREPGNIEGFAGVIRTIHRLQRNLVLVSEPQETAPAAPGTRRIDIWWRGGEANIGLIVALAYLLTQGTDWADSRLVLKRIADEDFEKTRKERAGLENYAAAWRIPVEVEMVEKQASGVFDTIRASSADADLVFMGLRAPETDETPESYVHYYRGVIEKTGGLPLALVLSAERIEFRRMIGME